MWRWVAMGLGCAAIFGAVLAASAWANGRSQAILDLTYAGKPSTLHVTATPEAIAQGAHLVLVTGCTGCHGKTLAGAMMSLSSSSLYAPNLTTVSKTQSDAVLDRAIRQGLKSDNHSELAMPSQAYRAFTDEETAAIIAYLRSTPSSGPVLTQPPLGLVLRGNLATGALKTEVARVAEARAPLDAGPKVATGRHLAAVACGQCHGTDLGAGSDAPASDLTVRGYYTRPQFHALLHTGAGLGEHMELMSETAISSFSHFTDGEIDAIYDYLIARDQILSTRPKP
jgi:mono/diheme cytochrome c family protein